MTGGHQDRKDDNANQCCSFSVHVYPPYCGNQIVDCLFKCKERAAIGGKKYLVVEKRVVGFYRPGLFFGDYKTEIRFEVSITISKFNGCFSSGDG